MFISAAKMVWNLFSQSEKKNSIYLIVIITIVAFIDVLGVASLLPFMTIVVNPDLLTSNKYLQQVYVFLDFTDTNNYLFFLGFVLLVVFLLSLILKTFATYLMLKFSLMRECTIGFGLLTGFLHQPYAWFANQNSALLSGKILSEVSQIVHQAVLPIMVLISNLIVTLFLFILLSIVNLKLAFLTTVLFSASYFFIYQAIKNYIKKIGIERQQSNERKFKVVSDVFSIIRDVKLHSLEGKYLNSYYTAASVYAKHQSSSQSIAQLPRYILELIAFFGMVSIVLYQSSESGGVVSALPIISLYAFAGYRLMPAMQLIYVSSSQIRYIYPSLQEVSKDFNLFGSKMRSLSKEVTKKSNIEFNNSIYVQNLYFQYPGSQDESLKNINFMIKKNTIIGVVGKTGSGKTTLIDVIMGLYQAKKGSISVDGIKITNDNIREWQKLIGYVPQNIHILNDTIANNISLVSSIDEIDDSKIIDVAKTANLHDFILTLPDGYQTIVGDRGVRLSGGQRQRIGLARALYGQPKILFLDEATSALDNLTELAVMEAVQKLSHNMTLIIVAHRLSTIACCDEVLLMSGGCVIDTGRFDDLMLKNDLFRAMVESKKS